MPQFEKIREFYPAIEPYKTEFLDVGDGHKLYLEQSGNPEGIPVIYLHGGPGGGSNPNCRRYFNPDVFRIVQFDQRGAGQSTPHASLDNNTTWDLVADIEKIRDHLAIDKWLVVGGSWGSTLAIAYTQKHPSRVSEVILRGLFLCRKQEIHWMYQQGASFVYPDLWETYLEPIPSEKHGHLLEAYYDILTGDDEAHQLQAARAWSTWEIGMMNVGSNTADILSIKDRDALAMARIECHFFMNNIFTDTDSQLLDGISKITHIPATLIQGRHDMICPTQTAWDVHKAWTGSKLYIIDDAAHSYNEKGIVNQIVLAADNYALKTLKMNLRATPL